MSSRSKMLTDSLRHYRLSSIAIACGTLFACGNASAAWVSTQTQTMTPQEGKLLGAVASTKPMTILVSLKLPDEAAVKTLITNMHTPGNPAYGTKLAPGEFTAKYAPSAAQAKTVADYLSKAGFTSVSVLPNRLMVKATGTAAVVQAAFNTPISSFLLNGETVFANTQPAQVPDTLGGLVQSVLGLQNVAHMRVPLAQQTGGTLGSVSGPVMATPLLPSQFPIAYDAQFTPDGSNTIVAIFMSGDVSGVLTDLRMSEVNNKEPMVPVQVVNTDPASTDVSGADEWDLDSQSSSGIAGNFKEMIWYTASSLDDAPLEMSFAQWVTDDQAIAANASFAECEDAAMRSGFLAASDIILMQAVAQGQTLFTSSGDTGAACPLIATNGLPDVGQPFVNYAGSSPYAVAVGGTTLDVNSDFTYSSESTWLAGGGGTSVEEPKPDWQDNFVAGTTLGLLSTTKKGTPDVSMDASPNSGAILVVGGAAETVGGTSLAAPLAMGVWARLESTANNAMTFAAPLLYGLEQFGLTAGDYSSNITGFHDITNGSNGLYFAKTGWDYTNGVGTFDICNTATLLGPTGGNNYCTTAVPVTPVGTTTGSTTGSTTGTTTGTTTGSTTGTTTGTTTGGGIIPVSSSSSGVVEPSRLGSGGAFGFPALGLLTVLMGARRRRKSRG